MNSLVSVGGSVIRQDEDGVSGSLAGSEALASGTIPVIDDRLNVNLPVSKPGRTYRGYGGEID